MKYFVLFSLLVLLGCSWSQECFVDEDCTVAYRCFEGNCIKVICPIGHTVENHSCVYTSLESSPGTIAEEIQTEEETETIEETIIEEDEPAQETAEGSTEEINEPEINETEEINEVQEAIGEEIEEPGDGIFTILLLIGIIIIGSAIVVYMTYFKKIR